MFIFWPHRDRLALAQRAALQQFGALTVDDVVFSDEPITLADAYAQLRPDNDSNGSPDDVWLETIGIPAAREYCELELGRALAPRTMELATTRFPSIAVDPHVGPAINLPFGPVQSIASVKYLVLQDQTDSNGETILDSNGDPIKVQVQLTLDASTYSLDVYSVPNRLVLAYGKAWPTALEAANSVKVRYVTGYVRARDSNSTDTQFVLPRSARVAILLMLGHLYENREATAPAGGQGLAELPIGVDSFLSKVPNRERLGMA